MSHHGHDQHGDLGHVVPINLFAKVLGALMVLTVITVWISTFDFGVLNLVIAMVVASVKALLVVLFFMHLKYENGITWFYAGVPLFLLATLLAGLFIDNPFRTLPPGMKAPIEKSEPIETPAEHAH